MIKFVILKLIRVYQKTLSPDHGLFSFAKRSCGCRYYPSCSQYTYEAIAKYGTIKGVFLGMKRVLRCNPLGKGGIDRLE